jgi:hypothetical protein
VIKTAPSCTYASRCCRDGSLCLRPCLVAASCLPPTSPMLAPCAYFGPTDKTLGRLVDCAFARLTRLQGDVVVLVGSCWCIAGDQSRSRTAGDSGPSRRELSRAPQQHHDFTVFMSCRQRQSSDGAASATNRHDPTDPGIQGCPASAPPARESYTHWMCLRKPQSKHCRYALQARTQEVQ